METNKGTSVDVELKTHINDGENKQTVHFSTVGRFLKKNNSTFLQFKEENKENGEINQIVKIDHNDSVTVIRQGSVSMKQLFIAGETTEGSYRSPYGIMLMNTLTNDIHITIDEGSAVGTIQFSYRLHMQHEFSGDYDVTINFRRNHK